MAVRKQVIVAEAMLDRCANTFGVAPCTATGTPCFNKFATCKDVPNFVRVVGGQTLRFCNRGFQSPLSTPMRPYIVSVDTAPTEIKPSAGLSIRGQTKLTFVDEPDNDTETDPYIGGRAAPINLVLTWPSAPTSGLTVIHGTASLDGSSRLNIINTDVSDSAFAYYTSLSASIGDFVCTASGQLPNSNQAAGLLGRAAFGASTMTTGYRFDCVRVPDPTRGNVPTNFLRLFRYDAGVVTPIGSQVNLANTTPYYDANDSRAVTFHLTITGSSIVGWLSAAGQSDSAAVTATDATYAAGRVGLLSYGNTGGGASPPAVWTSFTVVA